MSASLGYATKVGKGGHIDDLEDPMPSTAELPTPIRSIR